MNKIMIYLSKPTDFHSRFEIVSCFLEYEGRFLLLHRVASKPQPHTWGVPAGKVEVETKDEAMLRELSEETGMEGNVPSFVNTVYVRYPDYDFVYHMYVLPLLVPHEVIIDSRSHDAFRWVHPEESLTLPLIPDLDACVKLHYGL